MQEDEYDEELIIGDLLRYQDPPGTFEGIEDLEIMEVYSSDSTK